MRNMIKLVMNGLIATGMTLVFIFALNKIPFTKNLVQIALKG